MRNQLAYSLLCVFTLVFFSACNPTIDKEEDNSLKSKEEITSITVDTKRSKACISLEQKLAKALQESLKHPNYHDFFLEYEQSLIEEGILSDSSGKAYLALFRKLGKSPNPYAELIPINSISPSIQIMGFIEVDQEYEKDIERLESGDPLKVYQEIIENLRATADISLSKIITLLSQKLNANAMDLPFYKELSLLFIYAITR